jgi:tetratricopeptide (TPR) repeat protein
LGLLYRRQGKIWKAIQEFRKTSKVPGWQARSQNKLMECFQAIKATRVLLSLRPSALKARFYSFFGKPDKVIESYENLLEKNPQKAWVYPQLSTLYLETGRVHSKAFWVHHKTLLLDPEQKGTALFLANYYLDKREMSPRALWAYEKALEFQPDNTELLNILLESCLKTPREEALLNRVCKRLYQLGYWSSTVCKVLSQNYLKHQRIDREAMRVYEKTLQWEPNNRALQAMVNKIKQPNPPAPFPAREGRTGSFRE